MGPNSKSPRENVPVSQPGHDNSDEFDANEFGRFRLSANFFKWAISTPLPRERDEDLWRDTVPPGQAKGFPPKDPARSPTAEVMPGGTGGRKRALDLSPSEAKALGKNRSRGWIPLALFALFTVGGPLTYLATKSPVAPPAPEFDPDLKTPEIAPETGAQQNLKAAPPPHLSRSDTSAGPAGMAQLDRPRPTPPSTKRKNATPPASNATQEERSSVEPKSPRKLTPSWFEMN